MNNIPSAALNSLYLLLVTAYLLDIADNTDFTAGWGITARILADRYGRGA